MVLSKWVDKLSLQIVYGAIASLVTSEVLSPAALPEPASVGQATSGSSSTSCEPTSPSLHTPSTPGE